MKMETKLKKRWHNERWKRVDGGTGAKNRGFTGKTGKTGDCPPKREIRVIGRTCYRSAEASRSRVR